MHIGINALLLKEQKSGTIRYVYNLIENLSQIDYRNKYTIFKRKKALKSNLVRITWEHLFLNKHLVKNDIDLLHSTAFVSPIACPIKTVLTIHDLAYFFYPHLFPKIKVLYYRKLIPHSISRAQMIIAISENVKKEIIDFFKVEPDKIDVIYYGLEKIYKFIDKEISKKEVFKIFGIKERFILFVGTIEPRKNLETLLEAFYILNKKLKEYKLVVAGPWGWLYSDVLKIIKKLNLKEKIIFTGYVDSSDLLYLYNACDLFAYPSLYEGFGLPVLEAFACGAPVITSNVSSMPEISGGAALLVNPRDSKSLADRMISVIESETLRKELIEKGIRRARCFTWDQAAKRTLSVYERGM